MLQAWIDRELGQAERIILEEHLVGCKQCATLLRQQQRSAVMLFETLSEHKLQRDFRKSVMENLPEMAPLRIDVNGVNWREKAPGTRTVWWAQVLLPAAMIMVLIFGGFLYLTWPQGPDHKAEVVGMVTQSIGMAKYSANARAARIPAAIKDYVTCGQRYETGPGARLMLTLRGPSQVRLDEKTRLHVCDDREINVETGHLLLDVSKDDRPFRVNTPQGNVKVFGTVFDVLVDSEKTVVTLKTGKVTVENGESKAELLPGEQVEVTASQKQLQTREVDVADVMQWANTLSADPSAYNLFAKEIQPRSVAELPAEQVFVVIPTKGTQPKAVCSFFLAWEPDGFQSGHCGYDVHVYNDTMVELFKDRIDASVFADKERRSYEINVPGDPIRNVGVIHVKIVPDFSSGDVMTSFAKVSALGI